MDTCSVAVALPSYPKLGWDANVLTTEPQKLGATYPKQKPRRHAGGVSSKRRESGLVQREYGFGICKRKVAGDVSVKSFWEGSDQLLHHIVEDLSSWDVSGTLSQIRYTIAPAIEATSGTLSQIGATIAPALDITSGTLSQIGSTIAPAVEATSGTLSQIGSTIGPAIEATSDVQKLELLGLVGVGWLYVTASPGVLFGAVDTFLVAPLQLVLDALRGRRSWNSTDFIVGDRMGEGSFGTVYNGALLSKTLKIATLVGKRSQKIEELTGGAKFEKVVLKKVKGKVEGAVECAEMEEWFNSRVSRAAADACAVYLGSFVADKTRGQFVEGGKWLVWKYEGDMTLATYMKQTNFPTNLEPFLFGSKGLAGESNPVRRRGILIQKLLRQLLTSVKKVHAIGIVHRDIKPANLVVTQSGKLKIIDFGAAIDLRTGKNFNPDRGMLDPDYCPPELFVMPEETPRPPAAPLAAILSPLLYILNSPDRFDTYSVGVILLQLACSSLRTPLGLQTFKTEIAAVNYNLDKWRKKSKMKVNFEVLDQDGGKAWDLARKLVCKRSIFRRGRLSAAAALRHPYFLFGRDEFASFRAKILP